MTFSSRPALFLDRDGVINVDRGFVCRLQDFEWMAGIFDVARTAQQLGMVLVVVTNQSGIGLGYYTDDEFQALTSFMRERFAAEQAPLAAVYHCPFHPEAIEHRYRAADHPWRKPRPGMLLAARDELTIDLERSVLLGDRLVDLQAGAAAGVGNLGLVGTAEITSPRLPPFERFPSLAPVPAWLENIAAARQAASPSRSAAAR